MVPAVTLHCLVKGLRAAVPGARETARRVPRRELRGARLRLIASPAGGIAPPLARGPPGRRLEPDGARPAMSDPCGPPRGRWPARAAGLVRLVHPFPSLLDAAVTGRVAPIAGADARRGSLLLAASMLLLQLAIGAANDWADAPARRARRSAGKPIPAGLVAASGGGVGRRRGRRGRPRARGVAPVPRTRAAWRASASAPASPTTSASRGRRWSWLPYAVGIPLLPLFGWVGATGSAAAGLRGAAPGRRGRRGGAGGRQRPGRPRARRELRAPRPSPPSSGPGRSPPDGRRPAGASSSAAPSAPPLALGVGRRGSPSGPPGPPSSAVGVGLGWRRGASLAPAGVGGAGHRCSPSSRQAGSGRSRRWAG